MIMDSGTIPAKDACCQCYQPPVFYWMSAMVGNMAMTHGSEKLCDRIEASAIYPLFLWHSDRRNRFI